MSPPKLSAHGPIALLAEPVEIAFRVALGHDLHAAVRHGVGREAAHEAIKDSAVAVALEMREKGTERNDLFARLAADSRLGLSAAELDALLAEPITFTGAARAQVAAIVASVDAVLASEPAAAAYQPQPIL